MKEFKIRCSAIGVIMTNPRSKSETPSETTKKYCQEWVKEQIYNKKKQFSSKYTDKGNVVEDDSLDFVAEQLGLGMLIKNEELFENDFLRGTPDAITNDFIIDVKNSWDCFTFPLFETKVPDKDYYYQAQGYMALTGVKKYKLIYTLMDTPKHLIEKEAYWYCKNNGFDQLDEDILADFTERMTFDNIEDKYRIKIFEIDYNEEVVNDIKERVKECRTYIKTLIK
jgi:hypothetical protein